MRRCSSTSEMNDAVVSPNRKTISPWRLGARRCEAGGRPRAQPLIAAISAVVKPMRLGGRRQAV